LSAKKKKRMKRIAAITLEIIFMAQILFAIFAGQYGPTSGHALQKTYHAQGAYCMPDANTATELKLYVKKNGIQRCRLICYALFTTTSPN